jgi:NAD(P)-dependent dehydrogenase (short-subunit alcohol dehydrogenase family)
VTPRLCLTEEHVRRFAEASGDRNPLHVDESFARATPYGRCIAHGALVALAALSAAKPEALDHIRSLDLQFKQPVLPGQTYSISCPQGDERATRIEVRAPGRLVAAMTVTSDPAARPMGRPLEHRAGAGAGTARTYTLDEIAQLDGPIHAPYACRLPMLSALAAELGAGSVPDGILSWLAAASYTVGMLIPGRDAVFVGARVARSDAGGDGTVTAAVATADDRTGLVIVQAALDQQEASARMTLQTFLRPPPPAPDRSSVGRHLPSSTELAGRNVLVVGGSRGLGAAVSGALATQGATVWCGFARSRKSAEALQREFGVERMQLLQFDASDREQARRAFAGLRREVGTLDGAILCAAPALHETALHPDASQATLRFVEASLAMTLVPLAEALELISPDGWLVVTSSWALAEPPEAWPHYVLAKGAIEAAAAYCARHAGIAVLVVRPPRMWTDSTNTPLARIDAAAPEAVASGIVRWAIGEKPAGHVSRLGAEAPMTPSSAPRG